MIRSMVQRPRQAIALLMHRDVVQVNSLIRQLEKDFDIYIHIDKKCNISPNSILTKHVWSEHNVHWGSYSIVESTVFLYRKILASGINYSHVILLSGDSLPVKSNEFITTFLNGNPGVSFIENNAADEAALDRRRLIWYQEDLKAKLSGLDKLKNPFKILRWFQKKLGIKRSTKGFDRTGSQWTVLSLSHMQHLVENCKFSDYRFMAVPDESFVQNHFSRHQIPYSTNLIYAHWPSKRSFSPHYIDEATYVTLLNSPFLFARKFEGAPNTAVKNTIVKSNPQEKMLMANAFISDRFGQSKTHYDQ
jgi:hypothetical protein